MNGLLNRAAANKDMLEMIYISNKGTITQRIIKVLSADDLTIKAYCHNKREFRTFKLENILSVGPVKQLRRGA
ncbi:WYL domain-containing protein [Bacillus sp. FSL K6-3431]|uniref:WYL domain-containing protein n=1 Tax=Bacillus sp. FSL K6-3431 TaxID=2921500 RepID=UPI0030F61023